MSSPDTSSQDSALEPNGLRPGDKDLLVDFSDNPGNMSITEDEKTAVGLTVEKAVSHDAENVEEDGEPSDEDDERDEDEDDEDDEEPSLKYQRITGAIPGLFRKDSASALAIRNKIIVRIHFYLVHGGTNQ